MDESILGGQNINSDAEQNLIPVNQEEQEGHREVNQTQEKQKDHSKFKDKEEESRAMQIVANYEDKVYI